MIGYIEKYTKINEWVKPKKKTVYYHESTETYNAYMIAMDFIKNQKTVFVVTSNLYEAQKYYDRLSQIIDKDDVLFYPADQTLTAIMALGSPEFKSERLYTLKQLLTNNPYIVVTTLQGFCQKQ